MVIGYFTTYDAATLLTLWGRSPTRHRARGAPHFHPWKEDVRPFEAGTFVGVPSPEAKGSRTTGDGLTAAANWLRFPPRQPGALRNSRGARPVQRLNACVKLAVSA
jgi:hypothetical protein